MQDRHSFICDSVAVAKALGGDLAEQAKYALEGVKAAFSLPLANVGIASWGAVAGYVASLSGMAAPEAALTGAAFYGLVVTGLGAGAAAISYSEFNTDFFPMLTEVLRSHRSQQNASHLLTKNLSH